MSERPKLTIKKPLSLAKEVQIHQMLKDIKKSSAQEEQKLSFKDQKKIELQDKGKKEEDIQATVQWLLTTYSEYFNQKDPNLLNLKIEEDIFKNLSPDHKVTKMKIRQAIAYYIANPHDLKAVIERTYRS